jgi:hypothetical protein
MTIEMKPQALKYKALSNTRLMSFYIFAVASYSSHRPLHKSCPTHGRWLMDGGAKPVFCFQPVFCKQMKFEEHGKNKQNIPRG